MSKVLEDSISQTAAGVRDAQSAAERERLEADASTLPASRRRAMLAAALGAGLAACGPAQSGPAPTPQAGGQQTQQPAGDKPVKGGTYTVAQFSDAGTLQPLLISDTAARAYEQRHYFGYLLNRHPDTLDFETKYGTAESYTISQDGLTYTFKLKPNLQWSDGKPITAQDYKFTYEKMMDPQVQFPYRSNWSDFESLTAPDDRTLVFKIKQAFCPALSTISGLNPIPKHVFENLDINDNPLNQKPTVGSGPWLLQEWVKDSHAVFVANDKFFLGRPNIDKYVYRIVKDQTVEFSMFKAGEVDAVGVRAEDWDEAKRVPHGQTISYYPAAASWTYIGMNNRHEFLKDPRVRQALTHAMDRQKMAERIRLGHAKPLHSIFASASWAYTDEVTKYPFDVNKAKQLLSQAGWTAGAGGTLQKDGKPFKVRVFYNAGNKEREQIATVAQQSLKDIGIESEVIAEEWNAYLNRINNTKDMELYVLGWSSALDPYSFGNIVMTGKTQNDSGYSNPKVDEMWPTGQVVPGCRQDDRKKIYAEIQKIISQEPPYIYLWENESLSAIHNRIVTNKLSKTGFSYAPWEWYSKTGK